MDRDRPVRSPSTPICCETSASPPALEDLAGVRAEGQLADHPLDLARSDPGAPGDLALLMANGSVPLGLVEGAPRLAVRAPVEMPEEEPESGPLDAELLGDLPAGAVVVRFARGAHAPGEDVVGSWMHILGVGAAVHQDLAGGVPDEDVCAAVQEPPRAQLAASDGRHHAVVFFVDDVHQLLPWVHVRSLRAPSGPHKPREPS